MTENEELKTRILELAEVYNKKCSPAWGFSTRDFPQILKEQGFETTRRCVTYVVSEAGYRRTSNSGGRLYKHDC